jgi:hypothetical protein
MEAKKENFQILNESLELQLYPLDEEFVGVLNLTKMPSKISKGQCETIIILDRSGSMGQNVEYITNLVLPAFFDKLAYKPDDIIHFITFDSNVQYLKLSVKDFIQLKIRCQGWTSMSPAIEELQKLMQSLVKENAEAVRILTISDGEIGDSHPTKSLSDELASFVKTSKISINSQAVRFFTSTYGQPDTTALCCLLQLNNVAPSNLLDIPSNLKIDIIVEKWTDLFVNDGLVNAVELQCDGPVLRRNPWDPNSIDKLRLMIGSNVFWVKEIPNSAKVDIEVVRVSVESPMSYIQFHTIFNKKLEFIVDQVKILKIIQSESK